MVPEGAEWSFGWVEGLLEGWLDGLLDGWLDGCIEKWLFGCWGGFVVGFDCLGGKCSERACCRRWIMGFCCCCC